MSRVPAVPAALAALVLLAGCGQQTPSDTRPVEAGGTRDVAGISGMITQGPMCPGPERSDRSCPDEPYPGNLEIRTGSGKEVTTARAAADGSYSVSLDPGTYEVVPLAAAADSSQSDLRTAGWPRPPEPKTVTVPASGFAHADFTYDTGIR